MARRKSIHYDFTPTYLIFVVFGLMGSDSGGGEIDITRLVMGAAIALVVAWLVINLMVMLLNGANKELRKEKGPAFCKVMVSRGMFYMLPFVILAALAQYLLGWNAGMSFASAAIMTAGASTGMEAMKEGAQGVKNILIPTIVGTLGSTAWMLSLTLLP